MRQPYMLPDSQCERLKRTEMIGLRMLLAHLSTAKYFQEDLADRLACIPYGKERLQMAVGGLRAVCDDIIGTITREQAKQIYGTMKDYDLRLLPKLTPGSPNIVLTKEQSVALMDLAREKCHGCVEDGELPGVPAVSDLGSDDTAGRLRGRINLPVLAGGMDVRRQAWQTEKRLSKGWSVANPIVLMTVSCADNGDCDLKAIITI